MRPVVEEAASSGVESMGVGVDSSEELSQAFRRVGFSRPLAEKTVAASFWREMGL